MNTIKLTLVAVLVALCAVGCGSSTDSSSTAASPAAQSDPYRTTTPECSPVSIDAEWSASVDRHTDTPCALAESIVLQWGRQQTGGATAQLPAGWACDEESVCRNGPQVVSMVLEAAQP